MLAPIALYPDPLLAQLLPAATLPEQLVLADRYVREGGDLSQVDAQPWDHSIKALARYPATLRILDENLAWTTDLGQAFLNQPADVMDSVQRLRAEARALGNLESTPQQTVVVNGGIIEILPARPEVIYVPVYQPEVVYVQRPPGPGHLHVSFGAGLVIGAWLNHDCDWHHHEVIVWHRDHPRPPDWWSRPPTRREAPTVVNNVTVVNNTTVVNQGFVAWRPESRRAVADRGDRGWGRQDARPADLPARTSETRPRGSEAPHSGTVAQAQKPAASADVHPVAPPAEVRPSYPKPAPAPAHQPSPTKPATPAPAPGTVKPGDARQASTSEVTPKPRPAQPLPAPKDPRSAQTAATTRQPSAPAGAARPAAPPTPSRQVPATPVRQASPALAGIENSTSTREASSRGQQSRAAIARPVAAARPAPAPSSPPKQNAAGGKGVQKAHEN